MKFNFEISGANEQRFRRMLETGATVNQIFARSLALYEIFYDARQRNATVHFVEKDGLVRELTMPLSDEERKKKFDTQPDKQAIINRVEAGRNLSMPVPIDIEGETWYVMPALPKS